MPTIIRNTHPLLTGTKRRAYGSVTWHVQSSVWRPSTDVYETETNVVVNVEVAGVRDEDLEVTIQDNLLLISGTRSGVSERRAYHQMEIPFGKFSLGIEMPANVIVDDANAEYKNGFLTIKLPKEKSDI